MPYNCLYLNKGNNSSVKRSILTKLIGYQESMILIICTKNELNLTNRYWDMNPDGRTDGIFGRTDGRRQNYILPTSSGDKKKSYICTISISDLSTKPQSSRVCVNSKWYLACWSTLLSLQFDMQHDHFQKRKLEDLKVLRRSPDLFNNVKIGQGQLQLIMEQILFYHIWGLQTFWSSDLNYLMNNPSNSPVISEKQIFR